MEFTGEYRLPASRPQVWTMLNDPDVLRACLPGCETLEGNVDDGFTARVTTKIGPMKATFTGAVKLSNRVPPESYTISGEGQGGVAGFAKGGADVRLVEDGSDTILTYQATAQVGGKIAQLGSRLIDATAKRQADQFFSAFAAHVAADSPKTEAPASEADDPAQPVPSVSDVAAPSTPARVRGTPAWLPTLTAAAIVLTIAIIVITSWSF